MARYIVRDRSDSADEAGQTDCFPGIPSQASSGAGFADRSTEDSRRLAARDLVGYDDDVIELQIGKLKFVYRAGSEYHMPINPDVIAICLQRAVSHDGDAADYRHYSRIGARLAGRRRRCATCCPCAVTSKPIAGRVRWNRSRRPSWQALRLCPACRLGALSAQRRTKTLAIAMNRLGAKAAPIPVKAAKTSRATNLMKTATKTIRRSNRSRPAVSALRAEYLIACRRAARSRSRRAPSPARAANCPDFKVNGD